MNRISDTLFAKYAHERDGLSVLENESGFILYKIIGSECFIAEMFVLNEQRKSGKGRTLIAKLEKIACDCRVLTGNIWLTKPGANNCLKAALNVGFQVANAGDGFLVIAKKIEGD